MINNLKNDVFIVGKMLIVFHKNDKKVKKMINIIFNDNYHFTFEAVKFGMKMTFCSKRHKKH